MKNKINNTIKKSLKFLKEITKTGLKLTGKTFKTLFVSLISVGLVAIGLSISKGIEIGKRVYQQMKERKQEKKKSKEQNGIIEYENRFIENIESLDNIDKRVVTESKDNNNLEKVSGDSLILWSDDQIDEIESNHLDMPYQMRFVIHDIRQIREGIDKTFDSNRLKKLKANLISRSFELQDLLNKIDSEETKMEIIKWEQKEVALRKVA